MGRPAGCILAEIRIAECSRALRRWRHARLRRTSPWGLSVIVTIAPLLAGLGLFFSGVHLISANLTPLAGKRFRRLLTRATVYPSLGALTGILAGIVTQSTNAVTHRDHQHGLGRDHRQAARDADPDLGACRRITAGHAGGGQSADRGELHRRAGRLCDLFRDRSRRPGSPPDRDLPRHRPPVPRHRDAEIGRRAAARFHRREGYLAEAARHPVILLVLGRGPHASSANPRR